MKQKKKIKALFALILAVALCCSTAVLVYAADAGDMVPHITINFDENSDDTSLGDHPVPLSDNDEKEEEEDTGPEIPADDPPEPPIEPPEPPIEPPEPPIEPDDFESPDEPDLPVYPMERVEFPPEEPEVPVEPVTPAEPEPQPEPAPQPEPEPEPQPEPEPAPQPEPAPTLPQTSQLWWPVGLVFILGFAMVLAGLVEMRKSRRHEDSDR